MAKTKRFMDGGQIQANTYPFANQNSSDNSVQVGSTPEPLGNVAGQDGVNLYKRGGKVKKFAEGGKADYAIPDARARAAMREVAAEKMRKKMGEAYDKSADLGNEETPRERARVTGDKTNPMGDVYKRGGKVKKFAKGGMIDGCAQRGKTRGKVV